jgi:hypothetical protein
MSPKTWFHGVARMRFIVGGLAAILLGLVLLTATSCDGDAKYAGLTRAQATSLAKTRIEAQLDASKRPYYEISIWNVAAEQGETESGVPVWLIGIWNGQSDSGDCALASQVDGRKDVRLISCASFPKYAR